MHDGNNVLLLQAFSGEAVIQESLGRSPASLQGYPKAQLRRQKPAPKGTINDCRARALAASRSFSACHAFLTQAG